MANVALEVAAAACVCVWHFLVAPAAAFQSFCVCVCVRVAACTFWIARNFFLWHQQHFPSFCACGYGTVRILDRDESLSVGCIFNHRACLRLSFCESVSLCFLVVHCVFCRCVCVCVPVTWYAINLKLDAFVDMGSRLGSTKHVLVSVVVQMTDNLVISLACGPEFTIITWFRPFNGELLGRPILRVCFFVPFWGQKGDPLFWPCFQFLEPKPPRLASRLASRCCVPMMKPL